MVKIANQEESLNFHEQPNGLKYFRQDYFQPELGFVDSPQSYLIKQLPNITNPTHFHVQNQFQVFIEGAGSFGPHVINPYIVHYAGAYTGYGPILAGPSGLSYLTLRAQHDPGAKFLPEKIDLLMRGPKHHYTSKQFLPSSPESMNNLGAAELNWDAKEIDTGLSIGLLKMPARTSYQYILGEHSDGVFLVVINGSIDADGQTLGVHKNVYVPAKETSFEITTTNSYAEILVLQMPEKNGNY